MVISLEMDTENRVQILDEAASILHSANILVKDMNPIVPFPAMGIVGQDGLFSFGLGNCLGKGKSLKSSRLNFA